MSEHPVKQKITRIQIDNVVGDGYIVGTGGITIIEACTKSGMHADIPYIRVWQGDVAIAEFCQHQIVGVYFEQSP